MPARHQSFKKENMSNSKRKRSLATAAQTMLKRLDQFIAMIKYQDKRSILKLILNSRVFRTNKYQRVENLKQGDYVIPLRI